MIERGDRARLGFEAPKTVGVSGHRRGKNLDRNVALKARIAGAIDLAHAAGTQNRDDFVRADANARREAHVNGGGIITKRVTQPDCGATAEVKSATSPHAAPLSPAPSRVNRREPDQKSP